MEAGRNDQSSKSGRGFRLDISYGFPVVSDARGIERAELHKTIWRIANDLSGSVDGWDFKSYVLGMPFTVSFRRT